MKWKRKVINDSMADQAPTVKKFLESLSPEAAMAAKIVASKVGMSDGCWQIFYPEEDDYL